jgi:Sensors of blue-light using FAD
MYERILYTSRPTQVFGSLALFRLLTDAQIRNEKLGITGHLLFANDQFTQCFEGPAENVNLLWNSIQRDERHQNIELLYKQVAEERRFAEWSMAFSTYSSLYVHGMKGFFPIDSEKPSPLVAQCF